MPSMSSRTNYSPEAKSTLPPYLPSNIYLYLSRHSLSSKKASVPYLTMPFGHPIYTIRESTFTFLASIIAYITKLSDRNSQSFLLSIEIVFISE